MKKFIVIFGLLSMGINAQVNRFIYEYKLAPNIQKLDVFVEELMILDVSEKESRFMNMNKFQKDSSAIANPQAFISAALSAGSNYSSKMNGGDITYTVIKNYPEYKITLCEQLGSELYKIKDDKKITWKILPDKEKIGNYTAQKATTSLGGRMWTAWFTTEVPIQDGPYKFHGLPGLIVKIQDNTKTHTMTLIANKKIDHTPLKSNSSFRRHSSEFDVNETQFKKAWNTYKNDPGQQMRAMMASSSGNVKMINNGKEATNNREMELAIKRRFDEEQKRYSNKIEPDLFK